MSKATAETIVRIEDLSVNFDATQAVEHVNLEVAAGEIVGIVGESGSGKSVTALTLMGLVADSATMGTGRILFGDTVLQEAGKPRDKALYRRFQGEQMTMVFQEPMTSLNPTKKVGVQVEEMLLLHTELSKEERHQRVCDSFLSVGLKEPEKVFASYPHQLSGGMRQRAMIAMATILHPKLIVADEPTTALDVTIQNQIIELLREINQKEKNAMIFITHDLNLARRLCHRIAVMKDGQVVECGATEDVFADPKADYTKRLIEAVPSRMKPKVQVTVPEGVETGSAAAGDTEHRAERQKPVAVVEHLNVYYRDGGGFFSRKGKQKVVKDADFTIYRGEVLGLVGESGCGKSTLSKAILGMNKEIEGEIKHFSTRPQMIFQDPYSSLNPCKTVEWLLTEPLRAAGELDAAYKMSAADRKAQAYDMLRKIGMDEKYLDRKPSQLSGGQRQRISIGQALITRPGLVIADEPVSALDVTLQAQIMELMRKLQDEMHMAYLFISHDINVVYQMSDRIMVMKDGQIVEQGKTEEIFRSPKDPYTQMLLRES
ncbi:MAG: ABC transporter ATP-binding protein [Lachnospiraceae bacterium]|nr:ABC transporter ATP-binding protein [Lachnospiraceae bacterium]